MVIYQARSHLECLRSSPFVAQRRCHLGTEEGPLHDQTRRNTQRSRAYSRWQSLPNASNPRRAQRERRQHSGSTAKGSGFSSHNSEQGPGPVQSPSDQSDRSADRAFQAISNATVQNGQATIVNAGGASAAVGTQSFDTISSSTGPQSGPVRRCTTARRLRSGWAMAAWFRQSRHHPRKVADMAVSSGHAKAIVEKRSSLCTDNARWGMT